MQIPHADEGQICPLHRKDVATVCHKCPWWTRVMGKNPQSEEMLDKWACAIALLPLLLVENASVTRGTTVAMETLRDGMIGGVMAAVNVAVQEAQRQLDAQNDHSNGQHRLPGR